MKDCVECSSWAVTQSLARQGIIILSWDCSLDQCPMAWRSLTLTAWQKDDERESAMTFSEGNFSNLQGLRICVV